MVGWSGERAAASPWALLGLVVPIAAGAVVSTVEAAASRPALAAAMLCGFALVQTSYLGAGALPSPDQRNAQLPGKSSSLPLLDCCSLFYQRWVRGSHSGYIYAICCL